MSVYIINILEEKKEEDSLLGSDTYEVSLKLDEDDAKEVGELWFYFPPVNRPRIEDSLVNYLFQKDLPSLLFLNHY